MCVRTFKSDPFCARSAMCNNTICFGGHIRCKTMLSEHASTHISWFPSLKDKYVQRDIPWREAALLAGAYGWPLHSGYIRLLTICVSPPTGRCPCDCRHQRGGSFTTTVGGYNVQNNASSQRGCGFKEYCRRRRRKRGPGQAIKNDTSGQRPH